MRPIFLKTFCGRFTNSAFLSGWIPDILHNKVCFFTELTKYDPEYGGVADDGDYHAGAEPDRPNGVTSPHHLNTVGAASQ